MFKTENIFFTLKKFGTFDTVLVEIRREIIFCVRLLT